MRKLVYIAVASIVLFATSCVSIQPDDEHLNDAQRLEKHDDYIPWWKYEF